MNCNRGRCGYRGRRGGGRQGEARSFCIHEHEENTKDEPRLPSDLNPAIYLQTIRFSYNGFIGYLYTGRGGYGYVPRFADSWPATKKLLSLFYIRSSSSSSSLQCFSSESIPIHWKRTRWAHRCQTSQLIPFQSNDYRSFRVQLNPNVDVDGRSEFGAIYSYLNDPVSSDSNMIWVDSRYIDALHSKEEEDGSEWPYLDMAALNRQLVPISLERAPSDSPLMKNIHLPLFLQNHIYRSLDEYSPEETKQLLKQFLYLNQHQRLLPISSTSDYLVFPKDLNTIVVEYLDREEYMMPQEELIRFYLNDSIEFFCDVEIVFKKDS